MKKTLILLLLVFVLVGCDNGAPNGLEPLVATEDALIQTLDGGWVATWADEFNGSAVDETKWTFEINGDGGGNNELQYYTRDNATVSDGTLKITAKHEDYLGKSYTSSRITTKYKNDMLYGRVQVRAKLPTGVGTWPAIWMMPTASVYGGWPDSGEFDIMEYVGYDPGVIHSTIHTDIYNGAQGTQIGYSYRMNGIEDDFHTYDLIWEPGYMATYIDDDLIGEFRYNAYYNQNYTYDQVFPYDQQFFLILNLAVGGNWGGVQGVDANAFPTSLEVDYVRYYQRGYATLDELAPSQPTDISLARIANTLFWDPSTDDYAVEKYLVLVDGEAYDYTNLNQYTFKGLTKGQTYSIQVVSYDFVGRKSDKSEAFSFTYQ